MQAEEQLPRLLRSMQPLLHQDIWVFVSLAYGADEPPGLDAVMRFDEPEGVTLVVKEEQARRAGFDGAGQYRMITLQVGAAPDAVGFLAVVTAELAAEGLSEIAISTFYPDRLLVPEANANRAMAVLERLSQS